MANARTASGADSQTDRLSAAVGRLRGELIGADHLAVARATRAAADEDGHEELARALAGELAQNLEHVHAIRHDSLRQALLLSAEQITSLQATVTALAETVIVLTEQVSPDGLQRKQA
jgi:hypothetical protein